METVTLQERAEEIPTRHDGGTILPAVDVKIRRYWYEVIRDHRAGVGDLDLGDDGDAFIDWLEEIIDTSRMEPLFWADDAARESGWEDLQDFATETFGRYAKVYSDGRSGGWAVVHNIGDPNDWARCRTCGDFEPDHDDEYCGGAYDPDPERFEEWARFEDFAQKRAQDCTDDAITLIYLNVWETREGEVPVWHGATAGYWA